MTVRDGQVALSLRAPDAAAQGGLLARGAELQQVLREAGLDLSGYDVTVRGEQGAGSGDGPTAGQRDDAARGSAQGPPDRGTPRQGRAADGSSTVTDDDPLHPQTGPQSAGTWL